MLSRARVALGLVFLIAVASACHIGDVANLKHEEANATALAQTSFLYADDGTLITELHAGENRVVVPFRKIPRSALDAVVAVEDRRFYQHEGIDLKALLRAAYIDATTGRIVEGGSTITQQYVKNAFVGTQQTLDRKIREAVLAYQVEQRYTKDQILTKYLNTVYFGEGAYGIQAAARQFFSREASDLSLSESALLAGLISAPSSYNPFRHPKVARTRRNLVLDQMYEQGMIGKPARANARHAELRLSPPPRGQHTIAPYFVDYLKEWFLNNPAFGETQQDRYDLLFRGGIRIYSTVDPTLQRDAERAVSSVLPYESSPYGAMTVLDPRTGGVRAMVGGRNYYSKDDKFAKLNLATGGSTGRQAGSAFKPFALVAALENGITPSKVYSAPSEIRIPLKDGQIWDVSNAEGGSYGSLTLEQATIDSVNTVYAQVIMDVGADKVVRVAEDMGIRCCPRASEPSGRDGELQAVPSAVLGTNSVNPLEMASAYGTLATGGYHVQPTPVTKITDAEGKLIWSWKPHPQLAVEPSIAAEVDKILQEVVDQGTGTAAKLPDGRPQIGKTGTAQLERDAWFVGAVPQLVAAVWVGFPQGQIPMQPPRTAIVVYGGTWPAAIWLEFMSKATRSLPSRPFPRAQVRYVTVRVDVTQSCLPNRYTLPQNIDSVQYLEGTEPTRECKEPTSAKDVQVPSVIGIDGEEAQTALTAAGFYVEVKVQQSNEPAGTVIAQRPQAGLRAEQTSTVTIVVSQSRSH